MQAREHNLQAPQWSHKACIADWLLQARCKIGIVLSFAKRWRALPRTRPLCQCQEALCNARVSAGIFKHLEIRGAVVNECWPTHNEGSGKSSPPGSSKDRSREFVAKTVRSKRRYSSGSTQLSMSVFHTRRAADPTDACTSNEG